MSGIFVHGCGAVSSAGWDVAALRNCLAQNSSLPTQPMSRPGWDRPLLVRPVPPPAVKLPFLAHARLRRASPLAHYAVSAALEAIGGDAAGIKSGEIRLAIITSTMIGGLTYSRRFYEEALQDPATASPLLFPETVFNAPASHLSAYLGTSAVNYTMVGDAGSYLQSLAIAAQWLEDGMADASVVIGAEELDWTAADAVRLFERHSVLSAGAGALYLKAAPSQVELVTVTDSFAAPRTGLRHCASQKMWAQLPNGTARELLCANQRDPIWNTWEGACLTVKPVLGEAFSALAAWQCAAACDALKHGQYEAANISITGAGRQTIGARFAASSQVLRENEPGLQT